MEKSSNFKRKVLVIGASTNETRYSYKAVNKLIQNGFEVVALGNRAGAIQNVIIETEKIKYQNIDTITLYLGAENQKPYYDYIIDLNPNRVIFNPGAENAELVDLLNQKGIKTEEACTLVMLSMGIF